MKKESKNTTMQMIEFITDLEECSHQDTHTLIHTQAVINESFQFCSYTWLSHSLFQTINIFFYLHKNNSFDAKCLCFAISNRLLL